MNVYAPIQALSQMLQYLDEKRHPSVTPFKMQKGYITDHQLAPYPSYYHASNG